MAIERYEIAHVARGMCGPDIAIMRFERPSSFGFHAGQYISLRLISRAGEETKPFTISSAPHDPYVEITTRLSDSTFKRALAMLSRGSTVTMMGPLGSLALPEDPRKLVFLAGGVGITPVRSMLRDALRRDLGVGATVFFGNRDERCVPYRDELDRMDSLGVRVVHVLEEPSDQWTGERGLITAETVRRYLDPEGQMFFATGPPLMVAAMQDVLDELGVPENARVIERFGPPGRSA
ncbi:MAG: FAD-dependent oxidoreductase [Actinomycetota bacterium]|nr:FAD-dependent oxidoreductase [Actinomycetota bacterium]